jgi:serine/threonine protein kinase
MMNFKQTVTGQQKKWTLKEKLGEGDAGEVYLVETLLDSKPAILKRPRRSNLPSDVMRQASQIRSEGRILQALSSITFPGHGLCLHTPALLDQSPPEEGLGEGFFIVIEQAAGFDLKSLLRLARTGLVDEIQSIPGEGNEFFLRTIAGMGTIPEPVLIRSLLNGINLLETIHFNEVLSDGLRHHGVLWNDVKPDHLFWDPESMCLTVIDWGNGSFLEAEGITIDRQHSTRDDYHQFILEMGAFLAESSPGLYERLDWPVQITPTDAQEGISLLRDRLIPLHKEIERQSHELRSAEAMLYQTPRPSLENISQSDDLQQQIVALGEMPDFASVVNFHARLALQMTAENNMVGFQELCTKTASLATSTTAKWDLLAKTASVALLTQSVQGDKPDKTLAGALSAGIADDWPSLLWEIFELIGEDAFPDWWEEVSQGIRQVYLHIGEDLNTPDVAARRLFYTLQTALVQKGDQRQSSLTVGEAEAANDWLAGEDILKLFEEEVVKKWREVDPAPPNSGINYGEVDGLLEEIEAILPGSRESFGKVLAQPKAHSAIVLDAWERKDFETARQALRRLLLWDPYRRRLLKADRIIKDAPQWLQDVRNGAKKDEPFYDYLTSTELAGRNLRNRVGPAEWLDTILDALKRLRKGTRPADLIMDHPSISEDIPWLNEFRSREILSLPRTHALTFERDQPTTSLPRTVTGEVEGRLGEDRDLLLGNPLDTWVPEARGSSARVFEGYLRTRSGNLSPFAIKIMRPERIEYALPLFKEETHILSLLRDAPGVTPLVECGYLQLERGMELPGDDSQVSVAHLKGMLVRYSVESAQNFLASMDGRLEQGWLPYLALVKRDHQHNLLSYCDAGYTRGWFLPLRESLVLAIQICDILQIAHDRNIAYRDHKILHYYWDPGSHGVELIDWNIAKRYSQGLTDAERQFDLVQFGARALHHILTGRPAPGALPLGPNQPEEIEHASLSYAVNWTYDDERLPIRVKEVLEQVLNQGYTRVKDLRADLVQIYEQVPDLVQGLGNPIH